MGKNCVIILLTLVLLLVGCSSVNSASPAARIVSGVVTNVVSTLFKWLLSLKSNNKTDVSTRSMMKFESGYNVETVFDGTKLGIEPYSVDVSENGEVLILDSENSNIYKITTPLSLYSRPKLVSGSPEGQTGHVDGRLRDAKMNHPKGLTVDNKGNVYIADTMNMAIRKISDAGVVTIAGGNRGRGGGHVDGPSEDAKFSIDFDVVYVESSCSLLVVDRGNQAIREIQLHEDDCSHQNDDNLNLGIAVLVAACFFGYVIAFLQHKIVAMLSYANEPYTKGKPPAPYQRNPPKSMRPPLIPNNDEYEKHEEGLFNSMGKLFVYTSSSVFEIFGGLFTKKKPLTNYMHHHHHNTLKNENAWPLQESFMIPPEDQPPKETRDPNTPRKNYPFSTKDIEKARQHKQSRSYYDGGWNNGDYQYHHMHNPSSPMTFYEQQNEGTNEIVFGAVQEQDYGDLSNNNYNVKSRHNYMSYSYGY
ncbi:hypothetical protein ACJIZ3_015048 [Penstemon smallii]|uniref:NHL repeat-containing protein n=1 Tax=Penstemon smallii TaxID=265156 RepID=A0ABD3RUL3_9LAMI